MRNTENNHNTFIDNKVFKYHIHDIEYIRMLYELKMMEITDNIEQVKSETRKCSKNMKCKK